MNISVVLAGGAGKRMGAPVPKQFLEVFGKPVIVYTLEILQSNPIIDAIEVVCVEDYIQEVLSYIDLYKLSKLKWVVPGGSSAQESIRNGIFGLEDICKPEDIVMLVMSVAPLIDDEIISDSFSVCKKYGNAIAGDISIYNFSKLDGSNYSSNYIKKDKYVTLNMPWTFKFKDLVWAYKTAYSEQIGIDSNSYTPTLMIDLGKTIYFSKDSQKNKLKLTTFDDVDLFKGYLLLKKTRLND